MVAVPSLFTTPVILRRPSGAGDQGSPVTELSPVGYSGTMYGSAEVEPVLQSVGELPLLRGGIEYPFLQSRSGLSSGIRVGVRCGGKGVVAIPLIRDIQSIRVRKPDAERKYVRRGFGENGVEALQDAHVVGNYAL